MNCPETGFPCCLVQCEVGGCAAATITRTLNDMRIQRENDQRIAEAILPRRRPTSEAAHG